MYQRKVRSGLRSGNPEEEHKKRMKGNPLIHLKEEEPKKRNLRRGTQEEEPKMRKKRNLLFP